MNYPKYQSHKEVSAAKITAVDAGADGSLTIHLEKPFDNVIIAHEHMKRKPKPEAGWYLVVYADGYISFSPGSAFEEGYTRVGGDEDPSEATEDGLKSDDAQAGNGLPPGDDDDEGEEDENEALIAGNVPVPA